jgi:hypothetical protein
LPRLRTACSAIRRSRVSPETFTYLADTTPKQLIDLRSSTVRQGRRKKNEPFISITNRVNEVILIRFYDDEEKFKKWLAVFAENNLQDDQLYQMQVVPKLLEQEQK